MTLEELHDRLQRTRWFAEVGCPLPSREGIVRIASLRPWAGIPSGDPALERLADEMEWLPSSFSEPDPVRGETLEVRAKELGVESEFREQGLLFSKRAMESLQRFEGGASLVVEPYDFAGAARGAAIYAFRRAAHEVVAGTAEFWCSVTEYYEMGHWPCGVLPGGTVAVL